MSSLVLSMCVTAVRRMWTPDCRGNSKHYAAL